MLLSRNTSVGGRMNALILTVLSTGILPQPGEVPTLARGESTTLVLEDGAAWIRILEQEYVFIRVTTDVEVGMTAYDDEGNALASCGRGSSLVLSAFDGYWFFVRLEGERGSSVDVAVSEAEPSTLGEGSTITGRIGLDEMGELWRFVPPRPGEWTFRIAGGGGSDLDLELYGPGMSYLGGSFGTASDETVSMSALPSETLTVSIARYGKTGSGEYSLSVSDSGDFPLLAGSVTGVLDERRAVGRYLLPARGSWTLVRAGSSSYDGDLDLRVLGPGGEVLWRSSSFGLSEALLVPPGADTLVVEAVAFDLGESGRLRYQVSMEGDPLVALSLPFSRTARVSGRRTLLAGLRSEEGGFLRVSALFEKTRDGDISVFRGAGPADLAMSSLRGDESLALWVEPGDTVWLVPTFADFADEGACELSLSPLEARPLDRSERGRLQPGNPVEFHTISTGPGTILSIRLGGTDRDTDFDMTVSGPGVDRIAQGWISSTDAAGDEEIAFFCPRGGTYAATVYTYERDGGGEYTITADRISAPSLAQPSPSGETWALIAGISGYPSAEETLDRAVMDALDLFRFTRNTQDVPGDHILLLVDEMATVDAFLRGIESLAQRAGPEDLVLVFFSGHGNQLAPGTGGPEEDDSMNETICLYDGEVVDDSLARALEPCRAPLVLILDACFSGGMVNDLEGSEDVMVLTAAREDRSVSERILTPILLEGSWGAADSDRNGTVTARELLSFVDARLQLVCPSCDAVLPPGAPVCPECGASLKGEDAVPRPEQGDFLDGDVDLWHSPGRSRHGG